MKDESKEKLRAYNIIWNACGDYTFKPESFAYDNSGKADLYWNYIIGAVYKFYDYSKLYEFLKKIKDDPNFYYCEDLIWIGLENCAFHKGKTERPVLENLRQSYAKEALKNMRSNSKQDTLDKIKIAHLQRIIGEKTTITGFPLEILNDLEFDESMNTEDIIKKITEIMKNYFKFISFHDKENVFQKIKKYSKIINFGPKKYKHLRASSSNKSITFEQTEYSKNMNLNKEKSKLKNISARLRKVKENIDNNERKYIEEYYGDPILAENKTKALEEHLCTGNHKHCHIHLTRGKFENTNGINYRQSIVLKQCEKNKKYYYDNIARNNYSISKLTNRILNTMLLNTESSSKYKYGNLIGGKVWRSMYLNDNKIFIKNINGNIGNLTIDIMLDASASQIYRQEIIATEAYIIAESLTRCHIPIKVYSFCNLRDYTIVNIFRDYNEEKNNSSIFNYNASGYNRDGLAIRIALDMIKQTNSENKILIILSDGRPNDIKGEYVMDTIPKYFEYSNEIGIKDTAMEVRKGKKSGISILCVFTGEDEDIPAIKKIYGRNYVHINSPERFADMVGILIEKEIKNIS